MRPIYSLSPVGVRSGNWLLVDSALFFPLRDFWVFAKIDGILRVWIPNHKSVL